MYLNLKYYNLISQNIERAGKLHLDGSLRIYSYFVNKLTLSYTLVLRQIGKPFTVNNSNAYKYTIYITRLRDLSWSYPCTTVTN